MGKRAGVGCLSTVRRILFSLRILGEAQLYGAGPVGQTDHFRAWAGAMIGGGGSSRNAWPRGGWALRKPTVVVGSAAAYCDGSIQSRGNKSVAGILEEQNDGDGGT